ncbi:GATA zinc finger domain-containing protein 14-like isoform X2 [Rhopalosiphum padi]|uniref:GATA zinc finger domain-containing protein 14-like isoform X2 n=1 Tax=Rhopalosiphum padi TaxID=40932 RepID=UPI00298E4CC4|nr:GATA zinc finger domain-containing protein 14-like isoform X2 [Rhopalosiphum padi]
MAISGHFGFVDSKMSEHSEERLSEQYPGLNFNAYIQVKRLTQEEIDKYTGKKQEKEKKSIAPNELIPSNVNEQEVQDDGNMENYTTQSKEDKSIAPNELIPNMVVAQEIQNEGNNSATNNYNPNMIIKQEIQHDDVNMEEAQEMENLPNLSNEFIPVEIKQEIVDEIEYDEMENDEIQDNYYNQNLEWDRECDNDFNEYLNNHTLEMNTEQENMFNPSINFIPNMINGSEIQNNTNMENYVPQENVMNLPISSIEFVPIRIKQEFHNRSTEIYSSQEYIAANFIPNTSGQGTQNDRNMETNTSQEYIAANFIPNTSGQGTQNDRNMETNTSQQSSTSSSTNGSVPNNIIIKKEIFDDGNIEVYTDVLMPSADLEYEDGTP